MGVGMGTEVAIRCAYAVAILIGVVDLLFFKNIVLLGIVFLILLLAVRESYQLQSTESYDDSFMGYDFSQGYTSLEKSEAAPKPESRAGVLARALARRKAGKQPRQLHLQK